MSGGQKEEDGWEGTPGSECGGLEGVGHPPYQRTKPQN